MRSRPEKQSVDIEGTAQAVNERPEKDDLRFVNIRMRATDYNFLKGLYGSVGLSMSAGMKMSSFYIAGMAKQGAVTLTLGGIVPNGR
jgi:hypothetical protein